MIDGLPSLFPKPIKVPEDYELGVSEDLLSWYDKLGFTARAADFNVVLSNLQRLGVLQRGDHVEKSRPFSTREGNDFEIEHWEVFYLTSLGYQLVLACQPPSKES